MVNKKIPVFLASDENYAPFCATTIASIMDYTKSHISFYILDGGISDESKKKIEDLLNSYNNFSIEYLSVDLSLFKKLPTPHHFSLSMFSRFLIPDLKPEFSRVIYSDVDVIFLDDIAKIYDEDLEGFPVAAVPDYKDMPENKRLFNISKKHQYFCSGLLIVNCDYWRGNNLTKKLLGVASDNSNKLIFPDLDVLNIVFECNYKKLRYEYCVMTHVFDEMVNFNNETKRAAQNPFIIHYSSSRKPWNDLTVEMSNYFWRYARKTLFFEDLMDFIINKAKQERECIYNERKLNNILVEKINKKTLELNDIYNSREWKAASLMRNMYKKIFPKNSLSRKVILKLFYLIKRIFLILKKSIDVIFYLKANYKIKFTSRKKRSINYQSKKMVFIDHSYHNKTKSSEFILEYLRKFYDVETVADGSWQGEKFPDLSFVDESYHAVIFWQSIPPKEVLNNIKNENIVFFPMYDGIPRDFVFWNNYYDLKIISFSKSLHKLLVKWGLDSLYIQFFPKPGDFLPGKKDEIFFWQRLTRINIEVIKKLFKQGMFAIHIHKAVDPGQDFIQPGENDEKEFSITYSDWFEDRNYMLDMIKEKGVYVAPREMEGIGMSFLEAMEMGKAVVAADNPTMNEYIEHGKTGYLFDLDNPKKIDFSDIENVQKNTYKFMKEGFENWEKNKYKIIDFIKRN